MQIAIKTGRCLQERKESLDIEVGYFMIQRITFDKNRRVLEEYMTTITYFEEIEAKWTISRLDKRLTIKRIYNKRLLFIYSLIGKNEEQ